MMFSCKYFWRKGEMRLKYDTKECKNETVYDSSRHAVSFVAIIKLEIVYGNIGHACFTGGKCIFDANMPKAFPLTTTLLNVIGGNYY